MEEAHESSLYLIRRDGFTLVVSNDLDGRNEVRASSHMVIPLISFRSPIPASNEAYPVKDEGENHMEQQGSLPDSQFRRAFQGYCYKLVAAVIPM